MCLIPETYNTNFTINFSISFEIIVRRIRLDKYSLNLLLLGNLSDLIVKTRSLNEIISQFNNALINDKYNGHTDNGSDI